MSLARARARTNQSGVERTNHETTAPPLSKRDAQKWDDPEIVTAHIGIEYTLEEFYPTHSFGTWRSRGVKIKALFKNPLEIDGWKLESREMSNETFALKQEKSQLSC